MELIIEGQPADPPRVANLGKLYLHVSRSGSREPEEESEVKDVKKVIHLSSNL